MKTVKSEMKNYKKIFIKKDGSCIGCFAKENYENITQNILLAEVVKIEKRPEYDCADFHIKEAK